MLIQIILITSIIIVIIILASLKKKKDKKITSEKIIEENNNAYERKPFLTQNERVFFEKLINEISDNYHIVIQVRLADIIQPNKIFNKNSKQYLALFRQISQWHVDYAIMNKETFNITLVIELDDSSHLQKTRQRRDKILNKALEQSGIPIIRVMNFNDAIKQIKNKKEMTQILKM
ncbi:DUF2726 domain-containing protein [Salmonella enterica]|nr:DUF2726 domain-containing protein [Salmonella enterica]EEU4802849.1 DUF2726 domain-containing protein [Salmonella enterica]EEU4865961.1 DUF2726 domain-containing protein [Salmonella enterica]EEU4893572.1 DUF2726 domain-containing protein [Salmonella enterica]